MRNLKDYEKVVLD